jgi:hypothetical protein
VCEEEEEKRQSFGTFKSVGVDRIKAFDRCSDLTIWS